VHGTVLVVNGAARAGQEAAEVRAALSAHGVRLDDVRVVSSADRLLDELHAALATRPARLLVGGGDGSISAAANLVAGTGVALGVLPLGTGNDFARNLRLPRDLAAACAVIAAGETRRVSVGVANGRVFLNALSFGVSAAIAKRLTPELKRRAGPAAYPIAAAGEALAPEPFRLTIDAQGSRRTLDALQVVVGNGRFHGGGTLVAPRATIDDDRLDVYAVEAAAESAVMADRLRNAWTLARVGAMLRRGRHLEHPGVVHLRCAAVALDAAPAQDVNADGEILGTTPVACRVAPGLLTVLAPRDAAAPADREQAAAAPATHGQDASP
jgi:YegS/Rv2252/BmrU family lipid kinase